MIKILIVEDDMVDQMAISRMIKKQQLPFHFDIAESVQAAVNRLQENTYDLIVSDLNLGDGRAEDIIGQAKEIPYILMSGSSPNSPTYASSHNQAYAVLEKDPQLKYLEELPVLLSQFFTQQQPNPVEEATSINPSINPENQAVSSNIQHLLGLFDQNMSYVLEMIHVFLEQSPLDLEKLVAFTASAQLEEAGKIAHKMKSGYNMMGLKRHHQLAEQIEHHCQMPQAQATVIGPMVEELQRKSQTAYQQLQSFAHAHH